MLNKKVLFGFVLFLLVLPLVWGFKDDLFCTAGTKCLIGTYAENASNKGQYFSQAVCNVTVTNQARINVINNVRMTNLSDGWHQHNFTNSTSGHYRYNILCTQSGQRGSEQGELFINNSLTQSIQDINVTVSGIVVNNTAIANAVWNTNISSYSSSGFAGTLLSDNSDWETAIILGLLMVTILFAVLGNNYNNEQKPLLKPFFLMMSMLSVLITVWVCRLIVQVNEPTATNVLSLLDTTYIITALIVAFNSMMYLIIFIKNILLIPYEWLKKKRVL